MFYFELRFRRLFRVGWSKNVRYAMSIVLNLFACGGNNWPTLPEIFRQDIMQTSGRQREKAGSLVWPYKIDSDNTIKAEAKCLIWSEQLDNDGPFVLKMYRHRGLAHFMREKILTFRAQREFRILEHLHREGIPCSIPHFWTNGYFKAYGFYEILCTRQIPNTKPLEDLLAPRLAVNHDIDLGPLFQIVQKMHLCGVYHGALSTKNILTAAGADNASTNFYLIDFARSWLFPDSIYEKKIAWYDIFKLVRSIENDLGAGSCDPYLVQYGFGERSLKKFYQDAGRYKLYSRKQKRIKNILKAKVFFLAILTRLKTKA